MMHHGVIVFVYHSLMAMYVNFNVNDTYVKNMLGMADQKFCHIFWYHITLIRPE